jgi:hypothetical protein
MDFFVYDSDWWAGREPLIEAMTSKLNGSCRLLLILGITGIGKTAFAERLVEEVRGDWSEQRVNCENNEGSDFSNVALRWLEGWGENIPKDQCQPQQLCLHLINRLREHKNLILIDSLEYLLTGDEENGWGNFIDETWAKFFVSILSAESCQSKLILTSQAWPTQLQRECERYYKQWHVQLLKGLEAPEQRTLFTKANLCKETDFPESPLCLIGDVYDGHPLALKTIAGEIKESWRSNIQAYWEKYGHEIMQVKEALDEALQKGLVEGKKDRWNLQSYTKELLNIVKKRVEDTFIRLRTEVNDAYLLLCISSIYRSEVPESWWLNHLEDEGYSKQRQKTALEELRSRFLIEDQGFNSDDEVLICQHNLIRSVAIAHRLKLFPDN